jgi:hypothetical protein
VTLPPYPGGPAGPGDPQYPYGQGGQPPYGAPPGGYGVPPQGYGVPAQAGIDPLVSPDYGGWWSRAMAIVKGGLPQLAILQLIGIGVAVLVQIPVIILTVGLLQDVETLDSDDPTTVSSGFLGQAFGAIGLGLLGAVLAVIVAMAITLASIHVGVSVATGQRPDIAAAFRATLSRVFPLIGWSLLGGLLTIVGVLLCVLPGVYLYCVFLVIPGIVAFERTNVIGRAFRLFHNDFGSALARAATIIGLTIVVGFVGSLFGNAISVAVAGADPEATIAGSLVATIVSSLLSAALGVLTAPLTLCMYADLRGRLERVGTPVLAAEIGVAGQQPGGYVGGYPPGY